MARSEKELLALLQKDPSSQNYVTTKIKVSAVAVKYFCKKKPLSAISLVIILLLVLVSILAPWIAPHDPYRMNFTALGQPPDSQYILGTTRSGKDVFSRLLYGGRITLLVGFTSIAIGTLGGSLWGVSTGYLGGTFDLISERLTEILLAFPALILALIVLAAYGMGIFPTIAAITIPNIPQATRVVRSIALSVKQQEYIVAAIAIGSGNTRIITRNVMPQCYAGIIILGSAQLGMALIIEASLGYLGVGIPRTDPTWGNMISLGGLFNPKWWTAIIPGIPIFAMILSVNLLGDGLRDVLDPRLRVNS